MKKETDVSCGACRRKGVRGVLFSIPLSRLEESKGHRAYECDVCHGRYKFIPSQEAK